MQARSEHFRNTALLVAALALALVASELLLRFVIKPGQVVFAQQHLGATTNQPDLRWLPDETLGWRVKPHAEFTYESTRGEFKAGVRTGEMGIRIADADIANASLPGDAGILFIGDSVTAAYEVPYAETFVAQVRERLAENGHNVSVTNAGIRGYATDQAYFRMKEVLDSIDGITHVVYLLSLNDPLENTTLHFPGRVFGKRASYLDPEGNVGFLSAEFQTGIWDRAYKFVGPGAAYGEVPVIETETTGLRQLLGSRLTQFEGSYLLTLIKITAEQYLGPASPQHKDIQSRYPYLKIEYRGRSDGALEPSVDVRWEEDAYPMMLAARLIELMAREVGRRGKKFQLALPLTMSKEYIAVIKKLLPDHVAIADPSDGDLALEAYRECGGTVTFEYDGHYSPCGHLGQAESIAGALTESLTGQ